MPSRFEMLGDSNAPDPAQQIDTGKRYDVYCGEQSQRIVVYRNSLFKGRRTLFDGQKFDFSTRFVELELADGRAVFLSWHSIIKFCEPGAEPVVEVVSGTL